MFLDALFALPPDSRSTRTLLRFLPLIIGSLVKDTSDAVWEQCLKLQHITEIVCAPSIDVACI